MKTGRERERVGWKEEASDVMIFRIWPTGARERRRKCSGCPEAK